MVRLAWVTDIHLNFLELERRQSFYEALVSQAPDAVLVTGDVGESSNFDHLLIELTRAIQRPVYFVLGNHDFYRGSIEEVRARAAAVTQREPHLVYLPAAQVVPLTERTALVGHDGWADARLGDFDHSDVLLNDYLLIEELRKWDSAFVLDRPSLRRELQRLGDESARHFATVLPAAFQTHPRAIALMHPPPYRAACLHRGIPADDEWLPHFTCDAVGRTLEEVMARHPDRHLTVLCGHTHCRSELHVRDNLEVLTGDAEYSRPVIQRMFELD